MEFFRFGMHIAIGDEWYGIIDGQNPSILTEFLPLFILEKQFLAYYSFTICDITMDLHSIVYH